MGEVRLLGERQEEAWEGPVGRAWVPGIPSRCHSESTMGLLFSCGFEPGQKPDASGLDLAVSGKPSSHSGGRILDEA